MLFSSCDWFRQFINYKFDYAASEIFSNFRDMHKNGGLAMLTSTVLMLHRQYAHTPRTNTAHTPRTNTAHTPHIPTMHSLSHFISKSGNSILAKLCHSQGICYTIRFHNLGNLDERRRKQKFYGEVYQIKQEMSTCDYELHFKDKDTFEQNGVNGAGIHNKKVSRKFSYDHLHVTSLKGVSFLLTDIYWM